MYGGRAARISAVFSAILIGVSIARAQEAENELKSLLNDSRPFAQLANCKTYDDTLADAENGDCDRTAVTSHLGRVHQALLDLPRDQAGEPAMLEILTAGRLASTQLMDILSAANGRRQLWAKLLRGDPNLESLR